MIEMDNSKEITKPDRKRSTLLQSLSTAMADLSLVKKWKAECSGPQDMRPILHTQRQGRKMFLKLFREAGLV